MQYGSPSYQMGDEAIVAAAATAPLTRAQAQAAKRELAKMRRTLRDWISYRQLNDRVATGQKVQAPLLRRPGSTPPAAAVMALRLRRQRAVNEAELAAQLHALLSEVFDPATLPDPDVGKNPSAAVELAQIAIAGKLPGESMTPGAQGFVWLWPLVIVVGAIAYVITTQITTSADAAKEKERIECIKAGACTDSGFWMKVGAIALVSWLVWDKLGVGQRVSGYFAKGGRKV